MHPPETNENRITGDGMTRREALAWLGAVTLGTLATKGLGAPGKRRLCRPTISGTLCWLDAASASWTESQWRDELDRQRRIGFDLLWLVDAPGALDLPGDPLGGLMDLCAKRKVQVILDTGSTGRWYSPLDLEKELDVCGANVSRIGERFRAHPAFYAWYVPHEIYMMWDEWQGYIDSLYPALVEKCKKAADVPVTLSPFFILDRDKVFGDFRFNEPDEYEAYWTRLIRRSGFDVIMLQDSGEHFSYVTNDMRRPFFRAMQNACRASGAKLWGNVETAEFECPSKDEYVRRYGRVHHSTVKDAPWRPVPIERLREKLDLASEFCARIVTWGYKEHCRPSLGPKAQKWYEDYKRYYAEVR